MRALVAVVALSLATGCANAITKDGWITVTGNAQYTNCPTVAAVETGDDPLMDTPVLKRCTTITGGTLSDQFIGLVRSTIGVVGAVFAGMGGALGAGDPAPGSAPR